jgi:hypothetical protein
MSAGYDNILSYLTQLSGNKNKGFIHTSQFQDLGPTPEPDFSGNPLTKSVNFNFLDSQLYIQKIKLQPKGDESVKKEEFAKIQSSHNKIRNFPNFYNEKSDIFNPFSVISFISNQSKNESFLNSVMHQNGENSIVIKDEEIGNCYIPSASQVENKPLKFKTCEHSSDEDSTTIQFSRRSSMKQDNNETICKNTTMNDTLGFGAVSESEQNTINFISTTEDAIENINNLVTQEHSENGKEFSDSVLTCDQQLRKKRKRTNQISKNHVLKHDQLKFLKHDSEVKQIDKKNKKKNPAKSSKIFEEETINKLNQSQQFKRKNSEFIDPTHEQHQQFIFINNHFPIRFNSDNFDPTKVKKDYKYSVVNFIPNLFVSKINLRHQDKDLSLRDNLILQSPDKFDSTTQMRRIWKPRDSVHEVEGINNLLKISIEIRT